MFMCRLFTVTLKKLPVRTHLGQSFIQKNVKLVSFSTSTKFSQTDAKINSQAPVVYVGQLTDKIWAVKQFSLFSSGLILAVQPFMYERFSELDSVILQTFLGGFMSFFFLGTPLMIHLFTKKYVTKMTLDAESKTFTASTISLFLRESKVSFKQEDVEIPVNPASLTTVIAKGKPLFLINDGFNSRFAFDHLMGFDKPIDKEDLK